MPLHETALLSVELRVLGDPVRIDVDVPVTEIRMTELLPALQTVTNAFAAAAARRAEGEGRSVSCRRACGACCRQLVPLAPAEALRLASLVGELPEARRAEVEGRFAAARERLGAAGLLERLRAPGEWRDGESRTLGMEYFRLGVPCPFLDEESCTIYHERPIACREYLVASPLESCAAPDRLGIDPVKSPVRVWPAVSRVETGAGSGRVPWVPLILAPEWAEAHPDRSDPRPGPQLLRDVFAQFARLPEGA